MFRKVAVLTAALSLFSAAAAAADDASVVAGKNEKVAGLGYADWLRISWQQMLKGPPEVPPCQSVDTASGSVAVLLGGVTGKAEKHSCAVKAGQPIYVNHMSAECSTVEKPPFFGRTAAELKRCARRNMKGLTGLDASVDGSKVAAIRTLMAGTGVFRFQMPKKNLLGTKKRSGRAAARGLGVLIRGLSAGTHTVRVKGRFPDFKADVTYTITAS